ncbi:MAG: glucosylceramidase [Bacteroidales bacterium]|jgi:glucosylceramidase|nr:glucosylceramidase [Bacteroidales bacterium]
MKALIAIGTILMSVSFVCCSCTTKPNNDPEPPAEPDYNVNAWVSTASRSQTFNKTGVDFSAGTNMSPNTIRLRPATTYQTMDGFGAAITGSTCYNLMKMSASDRADFLKEVFDTATGLGYSYVRISIGASDFSLSEYTCWDVQGADNFGLTSEETNYVIPIMQEILAINPKLKVIGSPWTCPRWMKVQNKGGSTPYNSWTSGHLNTAHYQDYATYFVKWIRAFQAKCVPIYSVTIQNEPLNGGNSASLLMEWDEMRDFVKVLGPKLQEAGLSTKVYVFDHNFNYDNRSDQEDYPIKIYNDATAASFVTGSAYHDYGGDPSECTDIHTQRPDKEIIFTEASIGEWNHGRDFENTFTGSVERGLQYVQNWCKAVMVWNLMLDINGAPYRPGGCDECYGVVDISTDYKTITRNNQYYQIGHLSKVVKPNAVRIGASGYQPNGLVYQAFKNTDGTYALVLLNKSNAEITFTVEDDNHYFSYAVPAKAAASLKW